MMNNKGTGLYFTFPEAIQLLTEYSNHAHTISFRDEYNNLDVYRHKGYLHFDNGYSCNSSKNPYCMDYADERHLELKVGEEMPDTFYIDICKMVIKSKK